ncbi:fumarylacetoacetate hydrolase family protein [candidate division KSB1 bacterium]|nr:fumarylacetoacetate hydrolase family protein [candidate division KSB1 bacterium]
MEYFSAASFKEVLDVIKQFKSLKDFVIKQDVRYQVPIGRPQKIICIGRNYAAHAAETGHKPPSEPMFFGKAVSSMIPHQGNIVLPAGSGPVEHEVELGIVISKRGKKIPEQDAYDYVAGYTIVNDISERGLQRKAMEKGHPWFLAKSIDTFCPIGPYLVPADAIKDPHHLDISLKINGDVKQQANTSDMIFKIPRLIHYISTYISLEPGDIIATGTPEGVSPIQDGDILEAEVEHLGILRNFVFEEKS